MNIEPLHMDSRTSNGFVGAAVSNKVRAKLAEGLVKDGKLSTADYRIELMFSKHRSSLPNKPSPFAMLIWESGKRLHGGGDQKMYWCGYDDCHKPISCDNFGFYHVVCPACHRELFLDKNSKRDHIKSLKKDNQPLMDIDKIPLVVGEMFYNMTPPNIADLLVKTWYALGSNADVYFKWSPLEVRYDAKFETTKTIDNLNNVRVKREPAIYTLKRILDDVNAGADLRGRFLAFLTS
jgi:hypothetical protein